ncbi:hypothetical protein HYS92_01950 [Candidatus Daviesbacteria bacterium]|nr:hypothetical protein [Candidatus Daviesbacteria bacterium]
MFTKKIKPHLLVIVLAVISTAILTWPLLPNITSYYTDQGDYPLAGSVLWYNADSIKTGRIFTPKEYWHGYQFYPQPLSFVFVNNSFIPSLIFAPIYWISGNLPFSVNSYSMLALILSFVSAFYTIRYFLSSSLRAPAKQSGSSNEIATSSPSARPRNDRVVFWASIVGAFIFTFNPVTLVRFPHHLDIMGKYFLPLVFLFAYKFLEMPSLKRSLLLWLFFTLNALTVNYYQIFSIVILPMMTVPFLVSHLRKRDWGYLLKLGKFGLIGLLFLPVLLYFNFPYFQLNQKEGAGHRVEETEFFSARFLDFIGTSENSLLYGSLMKSIFPSREPKDDRGILNYEEHSLFLNILPLILFIVGWKAFAKQNLNHAYFYIMAVVSFLFLFGYAFPPFKWLYNLVPIMQGIRSPTRFEFLFYIPFALICAFGVKRVLEKRGILRLRSGQVWVIGMIGLILLLENFYIRDFSERSQFLQQAKQAEGLDLKGKITLHLPIYTTEDADEFGKNSAYLNWVTQTGERIINGNTAYLPPDQLELLHTIKQNFDENSLKRLILLGADYVIVHKNDSFEVIDLSKYKFEAKICILERDFDIELAQVSDLDSKISYALVLKNKSDCYLPSLLEERYRKIEVRVEGKIKQAYFRLPILVGPGEQLMLSEVNRELQIK